MSLKSIKDVTQLDDIAATLATNVPAVARRGPIRRQRKSSEHEKQANGRTHEENQERAYIAASRRSDRSIEARLESARRASEIHKRRCGRGLKVTEEAVMNEEMYEEEDPDYEQRVSRLRMVMNTPNYPYSAFSPMQQQFYPQKFMMPDNTTTSDGSTHNHATPGTPGAGTTMEQQHPQHQYLFSPWFNQNNNGLNQMPVSPMSPGATTLPGNFGPMSPSLPNYHASPVASSHPSPHFLPPTQFPSRVESRQVPKSANPAPISIPETEVVFDSASLDLFADVNLDASDDLWYTADKNGNQQQDWLT